MARFDTLSLHPDLLTGIARLGYEEMTEIQARSLPVALRGRDIIGRARTGSGKTAAFALPLLSNVNLEDREPQALVLSPTRELADQLVAAIRSFAVGMEGLRVVCLSGGRPSRDQRDALQAGAHVVVGTPGRILHQIQLGRFDASNVRTLVLDEADRMLDMGFEDEVLEIIHHVPKERQTMLFSATWQSTTQRLSAQIQNDPHTVKAATLLEDNVLTQRAVLCTRDNRPQALADLLAKRTPGPTLVFCETRGQCDDLAGFLQDEGVSALTLHGERDQNERDEVMACFRNGSALVLVATNVAARGLDVAGIELVVCYELSPDPAVHIHRIGRTARAESEGEAVSLVAKGTREQDRLDAIEAHMKVEIPRSNWEPVLQKSLAAWSAPYRTLVILGGRRDKLRPGDIVGALTRAVGLDGDDIGEIVLTDRRAWVAVKAGMAQKAVKGLNNERIKKKRFRVILVSGQRR